MNVIFGVPKSIVILGEMVRRAEDYDRFYKRKETSTPAAVMIFLVLLGLWAPYDINFVCGM